MKTSNKQLDPVTLEQVVDGFARFQRRLPDESELDRLRDFTGNLCALHLAVCDHCVMIADRLKTGLEQPDSGVVLCQDGITWVVRHGTACAGDVVQEMLGGRDTGLFPRYDWMLEPQLKKHQVFYLVKATAPDGNFLVWVVEAKVYLVAQEAGLAMAPRVTKLKVIQVIYDANEEVLDQTEMFRYNKGTMITDRLPETLLAKFLSPFTCEVVQ